MLIISFQVWLVSLQWNPPPQSNTVTLPPITHTIWFSSQFSFPWRFEKLGFYCISRNADTWHFCEPVLLYIKLPGLGQQVIYQYDGTVKCINTLRTAQTQQYCILCYYSLTNQGIILRSKSKTKKPKATTTALLQRTIFNKGRKNRALKLQLLHTFIYLFWYICLDLWKNLRPTQALFSPK